MAEGGLAGAAVGLLAMRVAKWGNCLAIRLPKAVVQNMDLAEGDEVELTVTAARQLRLQVKPDKEVVVAALREFEGRLPADFKYKRD